MSVVGVCGEYHLALGVTGPFYIATIEKNGKMLGDGTPAVYDNVEEFNTKDEAIAWLTTRLKLLGVEPLIRNSTSDAMREKVKAYEARSGG